MSKKVGVIQKNEEKKFKKLKKLKKIIDNFGQV